MKKPRCGAKTPFPTSPFACSPADSAQHVPPAVRARLLLQRGLVPAHYRHLPRPLRYETSVLTCCSLLVPVDQRRLHLQKLKMLGACQNSGSRTRVGNVAMHVAGEGEGRNRKDMRRARGTRAPHTHLLSRNHLQASTSRGATLSGSRSCTRCSPSSWSSTPWTCPPPTPSPSSLSVRASFSAFPSFRPVSTHALWVLPLPLLIFTVDACALGPPISPRGGSDVEQDTKRHFSGLRRTEKCEHAADNLGMRSRF